MYDLKCQFCGREAKHRHNTLMCTCGNLMHPKPKKADRKQEVKNGTDD